MDYTALLAAGPAAPPEAVVAYLRETLPFEWLDAYIRSHPGMPNVLRIENGPIEYLFDFASDPSLDDQPPQVEDRLVAVHGISNSAKATRPNSRIRGFPLNPVQAAQHESGAGTTEGTPSRTPR